MNRKRILILTLSLIIAASAIVSYVLQTQPTTSAIGYGDITVAEAQALIDSDAAIVIIDVRTPEEYANGHIEGAILIPVSAIADRLDELSTEDDLLIYCRTGNRSTQAVNILYAQGYLRLFHMVGGITAWMQAGYATVN